MSHVQLNANTLSLNGKIDFNNAEAIYKQGLSLLKSVKTWPVVVDLSQIESGNTLLLAMILQWLKQMPDMQSLRLGKVPPQMIGILQASHLESLMH